MAYDADAEEAEELSEMIGERVTVEELRALRKVDLS